LEAIEVALDMVRLVAKQRDTLAFRQNMIGLCHDAISQSDSIDLPLMCLHTASERWENGVKPGVSCPWQFRLSIWKFTAKQMVSMAFVL